MADQAQLEQWTGKRYTAAGTIESFPVALTGGHLVAQGLGAPLPIVSGRTGHSCGKWVVQAPGTVGTSGTILSLETDGRRLAICGQDVLLPDCRYQLPPGGTMDLFMDAGEFRGLLAAIDAALGAPDRTAGLGAEAVTIAVHQDRHSPVRVILGIALLFVGMFALVGLAYLASFLLGEAALMALVVVFPIVVIAALYLMFVRGRGAAAYHLIIQGEQIELATPKPSAPNRVMQALQVEVGHYEYVQKAGNVGVAGHQTNFEFHHPVIELGLPDMKPLPIRSADTTLIDRVAWPGAEAPRGTPFLVGPAELLWLHETFGARAGRLQ